MLFLMVVFVILTTCAHVYFKNTISNIDTETRSVIYGIGIHTVSSYQHNIAWFKFRGADSQFTVWYYLVNNFRPTNFKGQLISKANFEVFIWTKNEWNIFDFLP